MMKHIVHPPKIISSRLQCYALSLLNYPYCPHLERSYATGRPVKAEIPQLKNLPRLPVPDLNSTVSTLLRTVKPFVDGEEYLETQNVCNQLLSPGGLGEKLQKLLCERAKEKENWLSDWWLHAAYLENRDPVVVHSSPGLVFPLMNFHSQYDRLNYASKLVFAALKFKEEIESGSLIREMSRDLPIDMSQYMKVMSSCRIPGKECDQVIKYDSENSKHIVVAYKNHFFAIKTYDKYGNILPPEDIFSMLSHIVKNTQHRNKPFGVLTTENRNSWWKTYDQLMKIDCNRHSINKIQSSIFLLALDEECPEIDAPNKQTVSALQMLHGIGPDYETGNRWYDKTIQFIVGLDGNVGLTYEHSPAEGPPITDMMDYILTYIKNTPDLPENLPDSYAYDQLEFISSSGIDDAIELACQNLESLVDDLEMTCFTFSDYGREFIKSFKLSPDSYIQMALQLAFFRLHNCPAAHYESASTRKFLHGRTETIRSCSIESIQFARKMLDATTSNDVKFEAMKQAINSHKKYAVQASNGLGVDRHLLGLKLLAIEEGYNLPPLFLDQGFQKSIHMRLSTSQVPSKSNAVMCYGPLVPDGYGVCYNPRKKTVNFAISAMNSSPETYSGDLHDSLIESLKDMKETLLCSQ